MRLSLFASLGIAAFLGVMAIDLPMLMPWPEGQRS